MQTLNLLMWCGEIYCIECFHTECKYRSMYKYKCWFIPLGEVYSTCYIFLVRLYFNKRVDQLQNWNLAETVCFNFNRKQRTSRRKSHRDIGRQNHDTIGKIEFFMQWVIINTGDVQSCICIPISTAGKSWVSHIWKLPSVSVTRDHSWSL